MGDDQHNAGSLMEAVSSSSPSPISMHSSVESAGGSARAGAASDYS